jgi:hypothetical protein
MGQMVFVINTANPSPSSCPRRLIIWRPLGSPACDVATTWEEVETHITETQGSITILVDGSLIAPAPLIIPATADTECFGRVVFAPYTSSIGSFSTIQIQDGGRIRNPFTVKTIGFSLISGASGVIPILLDKPGGQLICREGGRMILDATATIPALEVTAEFVELAAFEGGVFQNQNANPALVFCAIDPAVTQFLHAVISAAGAFLPFQPNYGPTFLSGGALTTVIRIYDSSAPPVTQTNFTGGYFDLPMSNAIGTVYQDALSSPTTGAATVQALLDILKRRVTGFGTTASRPAIPTDIDTGGMYFDTDLGKPVWSNGAIYVDADAVPA